MLKSTTFSSVSFDKVLMKAMKRFSSEAVQQLSLFLVIDATYANLVFH